MKQSRILFVTPRLGVGGAELHLLWLLTELRSAGYEPELFALVPDGSLTSTFRERGIPVFETTLRSNGLPRIVQSAIALYWHLLKNRYQIIHTFLPAAYLIGTSCALFGSRAKRVMSRRSLNIYRAKHPLIAKLEPMAHKVTHIVSGNSSAVLADLRDEGLPERKLRLIHNGVGRVDRLSEEARSRMRQALQINDSAFVITNVANLFAYKGHATMLEALAQSQSHFPENWVTLFIGRDSEIGPSLREQAGRLGIEEHVRWLGEQPKPMDFLQISDVGLHGSLEEGFSNAILEAMSAGLPVVATAVGGNTDAIVHDQTGLLVPVGDAEAMAAALTRLANDIEYRRQMGKAALDRATHVFSYDNCLAKYLTLYEEL